MRITFLIELLSFLFVFASNQQIRAIEAGTILVQDKFIRLNTCITKTFELEMRKDYFDQYKDISAIAAISQTTMDDQLTFQFTYNLNCLKPRCVFELQFERFNPHVNPLRKYEVAIDFLIGHDIKSMDVNMTNYRQIVNTQVNSFERAILIPNGFNKMSLTGSIELIKIQQNNFLLKHSDKNEDSRLQFSVDWPQNKNFILYKVVFLFHSYKVGNNINNLFPGFWSTKDSQVVSQYNVNQQTLQILDHSSQGYASYFYLPFSTSSTFKDQRKYGDHVSQVKVQKSSNFNFFIIGIILFVIVELSILAYRNKINKKRLQDGIRQPATHLPEVFISYNQHLGQRVERTSQEVPCQSAGKIVKCPQIIS